MPDAWVKKDPWLIFYHTLAKRIKGGKKNIKDFQKAYDLFEIKNDPRGQILCIAYLIEASVFIRQPSHIILKQIQTLGHGILI